MIQVVLQDVAEFWKTLLTVKTYVTEINKKERKFGTISFTTNFKVQISPLMENITKEMRFRQRLCEYAIKHGVTCAARRYHTNRQFVYRQLKNTTEMLGAYRLNQEDPIIALMLTPKMNLP